eukprot:Amastigsp_a429_239.p2 type:complete len:281 gc:universal Amastigsp_a429_239:971-1813(+)
MVRRARRGPERGERLLEEREQSLWVQERFGLLVQVGLVRRPAAFGNKEKVVVRPRRRHEIDLGRQIGPRVLLLVHRQRRNHRVAQRGLGVRFVHPPRNRLLVTLVRPHILAFLADDVAVARVLARRELHARGNVGVLEKLQGDKAVVLRRLGVLENVRELLKMRGAEQMRHVAERGRREERQPLRRNLEDLAALHGRRAHVVARDLAPRDIGLALEAENVLVLERRRSSRRGSARSASDRQAPNRSERNTRSRGCCSSENPQHDATKEPSQREESPCTLC